MAKYQETLDVKPPPQPRRRWWRIITRRGSSFSIFLLAAMLMLTVLWPYMVITVPSGHVGVHWKRFNDGFDFYCWCVIGRGTVLDPRDLRDEGLHVIFPWDKLFIYNLRLQSKTETFNAISKDGVNVAAEINVRYQLIHNTVAVLHKFIGPDYFVTVVSPEIGSRAREVISQYTAQEVYTSREAIQDQIRDSAQRVLSANLDKLVQPAAMEQPDPRHYADFLRSSIQILDTLVLSIELPPEIVTAINRQTEQWYEIQQYKYRVEREVQESRRKQVEANGIAAFQKTVSEGISDSYLRWRGIEATLALSQSSNAKIVIVGGGKDGLPIILGNVDTATPPSPPRQPGPAGTSPLVSSATDSTPPAASPTAAASADKPPDAPTQFNFSTFESTLSRILQTARPTGSGPAPGTAAEQKQ
jgi:prohibitin 2